MLALLRRLLKWLGSFLLENLRFVCRAVRCNQSEPSVAERRFCWRFMQKLFSTVCDVWPLFPTKCVHLSRLSASLSLCLSSCFLDENLGPPNLFSCLWGPACLVHCPSATVCFLACLLACAVRCPDDLGIRKSRKWRPTFDDERAKHA